MARHTARSVDVTQAKGADFVRVDWEGEPTGMYSVPEVFGLLDGLDLPNRVEQDLRSTALDLQNNRY